METAATLYQKYVTEGYDEKGVLNRFDIHCPENFNFAYDVIDRIAELEPHRRAMVWTDEHGAERTFTFADFSEASNRVANMLYAKGIRKGDKVMLVLKRHYEFWFTILALHKIGAVTIPATNLLTTKDVAYRIEALSVRQPAKSVVMLKKRRKRRETFCRLKFWRAASVRVGIPLTSCMNIIPPYGSVLIPM